MKKELLSPPQKLVDQWKADAFREYGCAYNAYDMVLNNAAAWGYNKALEEIATIVEQAKVVELS